MTPCRNPAQWSANFLKKTPLASKQIQAGYWDWHASHLNCLQRNWWYLETRWADTLLKVTRSRIPAIYRVLYISRPFILKYSHEMPHSSPVRRRYGCLWSLKSDRCSTNVIARWDKLNKQFTLISKFLGPTWGPTGAGRVQLGPMLAHEPSYLGALSYK